MQIAKALGAEVTGVCSTRNVELVRSIGADHVIDYTKEDFTQSGAALRPHPRQRLEPFADRSPACAHPDGTLIPNGGGFDNRWFASGGRIIRGVAMFQFASQTLAPFLVSPNHEDLAALVELIEAGKVTPVIERTYPLSEVDHALDHVGMGHARGKVAITVAT